MIRYTNLQLATVIALPAVSILLIWTVAIFHKNRKRWGPYDIPIVSLLVLSIVRNACVLAYVLVIALNEQAFDVEYCGAVVWLFNSIHTFQATVLATVAVVGVFSSKLHRNKQNLRQFLTATHVVYHLFCLTTLCACVGVAAILARGRSADFQNVTVFNTGNPCGFLPFELDVKFNVFILVLHGFLAAVSFGSFLLICYHHCRSKRGGNFDYLKKSNSDLSDLSLGGLANENKNYYDTYTVQKGDDNVYEVQNQGRHGNNNNNNLVWNSDMSNISTTVSSTNSRRPCISKKQYETIEDWNRTGLETIHPVLIVCYLFYHLPVMVLCIYPTLVFPYPVSGIALWLGLLQDLLIPIGLGIVDSRFCKWVVNVYRCSSRRSEEKLPHVGLDGKFRPFGSSQPQSLEVNQVQDRTIRGFQTIEHRFPITSGNLYTSIDGNNRLPVIQNYRRQHREHMGIRPIVQEPPKTASNVSLHQSTHLKRPLEYEKATKCMNCEANLCPSHSDLHHLSPDYINKQLNYLHKAGMNRLSLEDVNRNTNLIRMNNERLSKSHDSVRHNLSNNLLRISQQDVTVHRQQTSGLTDYSNSSDDEYVSDVHGNHYDSSSSCNSITTEANCDFEFYNKEDIMPETENKREEPSPDNCFGYDMQSDQDYFSITAHPIMSSFKPNEYKMLMQNKSESNLSRNDSLRHNDKIRNFKITRSNSKRSLENFQTFIETDINANMDDAGLNRNLKRSNSFMTLEDRRKEKKKMESEKKLKDRAKPKTKSTECIPNARLVFVENFGRHVDNKYVGSVPDFKKVFISEYI